MKPDERAALERVVAEVFHDHGSATLDPADIAIWRAARAYQAEQDAIVCDKELQRLDEQGFAASICAKLAALIRERAKGLA